MAKKDEDKLLNGNYDGIQEYDNDLPKWWIMLFYLTIIIGVVYVGWYHLIPGNKTAEILALEMKAIEAKKASALAVQASASRNEETLLQFASSDTVKLKGKEIFTAKCAVCHGPAAEGLVGPNLTDSYWIHGGKIIDIRNTIENGVLDKGMLAWKGVIPVDDIDSVVSFIWSIKGTNVPGKAPQGELVP